MRSLDDLTREELLTLLRVYAKNWLAHDGCWFLAAEEAHGMATAVELDTRSWERFAVAEARRIMREFQIPENGGLASLERAMQYRLYAAINPQEVEHVDSRTMRFRMVECRVQKTRAEKGLPSFPCRSVGMVEFSQFSRTVDPRIQTRCLSCPPNANAGNACAWEFTLSDGE
jgi:hypothetical protein